jgi:phenylacetic acid degradation protein PaaD
VQAIKAGILEIADVLAVTKSDLPAARTTAAHLQDMLQLRAAPGADAWRVEVVCTSASTGEGVAALLDRAEAHALTAGRGRRLGSRPALPPLDAPADAAARVTCLAAADSFMRSMGISCIDAGPGRTTVTMDLSGAHLDFNGRCHAGVIFTLAEAAFNLASNSRGHLAAGIDAHIAFEQAARAGDTLVARASEVSTSDARVVYRVEVVRGDGQSIARFTGTARLTAA